MKWKPYEKPVCDDCLKYHGSLTKIKFKSGAKIHVCPECLRNMIFKLIILPEGQNAAMDRGFRKKAHGED